MANCRDGGTMGAEADDTPTVSPVVGDGADAHRLVRAGAWNFKVWEELSDGEPRVLDLEAGKRLGFGRERDFRKLVKRTFPGEKLNEIHQRATVARAGQVAAPNEKELWLTEAQLLKVIARSETPIADAILDDMIRVYVAVRKGLVGILPQTPEGMAMALKPIIYQMIADATAPLAARIAEQGRAVSAIREAVDKLIDAFGALAVAQQKGRAEVLAILAKLGEQNDRLAQAILTSHDLVIDTNKLARTIASRDGTIPGEEVDKIKDKVARLVELRAAKGGLLGDRKAMAAIRADVYADLFAYLNWGRKGQGLASMPAEKGPLAKAFLDFAIRKLVKGDRRKDSAQPPQVPQDEASRQPNLFGDKPGNGSDKPN